MLILLFTTADVHAKVFNSKYIKPINIEQIFDFDDDSLVRLKGHIIAQTSLNNYILQDNTGTIKLEIDTQCWGQQTVTSFDVVIIEGEIERDAKNIMVAVKEIKKL